ncbi:hypothetical protein TruAng_012340 [Truncatella angustata]|nr:hypothetical protein TruAng_012340 [Truncatella angustata]
MQAPPPPRARRPQARAHLAQLRSNGRAVFRGQGTHMPARMPTSMPTSTKGLTALPPKLVQHQGQLAADPLADTMTHPLQRRRAYSNMLETWVMKLKEVFEPEQEDFMDPALFQEDAFVQE